MVYKKDGYSLAGGAACMLSRDSCKLQMPVIKAKGFSAAVKIAFEPSHHIVNIGLDRPPVPPLYKISGWLV